MASRRRKLQRSHSTLTSTSTSLNSNSDSIEVTNILSKGDRSSSTASFRRLFDSFRGKHNSENSSSTNNVIVDKLHQYSWKYATWSSKRSKSMTNVEQQVRLIHHNQSFQEEQDKNAKNNFSWSETSGVKIIRSLSDLNQALGKKLYC